MSKKKEDKTTIEKVEKEEVKDTKKVAKKTSKKTKVKKKSNLPLRTLIELVEESDIRRKDIIVRLARHNYLAQFYEEEEKRKIGYPIKPTINEDEFKKIIGE